MCGAALNQDAHFHTRHNHKHSHASVQYGSNEPPHGTVTVHLGNQCMFGQSNWLSKDTHDLAWVKRR
ncbi:hypothetical protein POX_h09457 [Penicillium oxalicum]|uniref:hypothetical protein n=1 Tax=Penicillium oxalicum TaxID=69781 RepID=UPI0020B85A66|nr:hypothetical protein POX_h09457 [Penicillium oxalicum]KAI2785699.1 hypothetical protein POX_h09457 [Penicillium oxalicum]